MWTFPYHCLSLLTSWQLDSSRVSGSKESKVQATVSFMTSQPWRSYPIFPQYSLVTQVSTIHHGAGAGTPQGLEYQLARSLIVILETIYHTFISHLDMLHSHSWRCSIFKIVNSNISLLNCKLYLLDRSLSGHTGIFSLFVLVFPGRLLGCSSLYFHIIY